VGYVNFATRAESQERRQKAGGPLSVVEDSIGKVDFGQQGNSFKLQLPTAPCQMKPECFSGSWKNGRNPRGTTGLAKMISRFNS